MSGIFLYNKLCFPSGIRKAPDGGKVGTRFFIRFPGQGTVLMKACYRNLSGDSSSLGRGKGNRCTVWKRLWQTFIYHSSTTWMCSGASLGTTINTGRFIMEYHGLFAILLVQPDGSWMKYEHLPVLLPTCWSFGIDLLYIHQLHPTCLAAQR